MTNQETLCLKNVVLGVLKSKLVFENEVYEVYRYQYDPFLKE